MLSLPTTTTSSTANYLPTTLLSLLPALPLPYTHAQSLFHCCRLVSFAVDTGIDFRPLRQAALAFLTFFPRRFRPHRPPTSIRPDRRPSKTARLQPPHECSHSSRSRYITPNHSYILPLESTQSIIAVQSSSRCHRSRLPSLPSTLTLSILPQTHRPVHFHLLAGRHS